jgi:CRISPR-associated protein Cas2
MARRLEELIHDRDDHVIIPDLGPADKVDPRIESLGKTFESVKRTAIVI